MTFEEFEDNGGYDPWEKLNIPLVGYSAEVDRQAIQVLEGIRDRKFNIDISAETGMTQAHVELFQCIFASADWVEYGSSPRGCWAANHNDFLDIIDNFKTYYEITWNEKYA